MDFSVLNFYHYFVITNLFDPLSFALIIHHSLQAQALCRPFVHFPTPHWERSWTFLTGICCFFLGLSTTIQSDAILRKLRQSTRPGQHGIPYGGLFHYVSNPHYAGELLEWGGFCLASRGSLPSVAFVVYTAANLIPRAVTHHQWYRRRFPNQYPPLHRKAIIPFVW
jgi:3-oxo-5-alpha-steroid 4-dehydrogenase 1